MRISFLGECGGPFMKTVHFSPMDSLGLFRPLEKARHVGYSEHSEHESGKEVQDTVHPRKNGKSSPEKNSANHVQIAPAKQPNVIDALSGAAREARQITDELQRVIHSDSRHSNLIVARGAAQRLIKHLEVLLQHEEEAL